MKQDYTHVSILIDRSGSMNNIKSDVIGGFNQLVEDQKKESGELTLTLVQFDHNENQLKYETLNDFSNIENVELLNESNYIPRGGTPLNDSLAKMINETGDRLSQMSEEDRPSKVLIICITDGYENASVDHTKASVKAMIEHQEQVYSWKFMYIGANQDSFAEGSARGIGATYDFAADAKGTKKMSKVMSYAMSSYRSPGVYAQEADLSQILKESSEKADLEEKEEEKQKTKKKKNVA